MDDMTLLRDFRAECDDADPRARAAAWRELEAAFASPAAAGSSRRGVLALAGAAALATIVAVVLFLGSGGSTQSAVAEVLHRTAAIAASGEGAPAPTAGPGQYYFTKTRGLELKGWYPGSYEVDGSRATRPGGFTALVPSETAWWVSPQGGNRVRETFGTPQFLSGDERAAWEAAGSPLPASFEPDKQIALKRADSGSGERFLEMRRGLVDVERPTADPGADPEALYPDLSGVPTDPQALRLAIRNQQVPGISGEAGKTLSDQETIEDLSLLLSRPNASPSLRAAAFDALAELPEVKLDRTAADLMGRTGYAVSHSDGHGQRIEVIFDPETSELLGERVVLTDPGQDPAEWKGYEAGFVLRDVAYLESKVVDSTREPALGAEAER